MLLHNRYIKRCYHSALSAKEILEEKYTENKIYVINSWTATGATQLMIFETCRMRDNGLSAEKAFEICEKMKKEVTAVRRLW